MSMETKGVGSCFEFLKPLAQITRFDSVMLEDATETIITKCTDFFKEGLIKDVSLGSREPSAAYW